jgi:type VI secretion system protein ImpG
VKPSLQQSGALQVYSVDRVTGYREGTVEKKDYAPLNLFAPHAPDATIYQVIRETSPVHDIPETFLALTYPSDGPEPAREVLTISLTCTNGKLPEKLRLGDISQPTSDSPELLTFKNILPTTSPIDAMLAGKGIWQLLSHLSIPRGSRSSCGSISIRRDGTA